MTVCNRCSSVEEIRLLINILIGKQRVDNDSVFLLKSKTKDKLGLPAAGTSIS